MIELLKIVKNFHEDKVLANFSLKVSAGEFVAILGESGCGKTTILNLICGLIRPQSGKIMINQKEISQLSDKEISLLRNEDIGYIFQEFHLSNNLSVLENVLLPTHFGKGKNQEIKAQELLKEVGLSEKIHKKIQNLSGGQKQRVAIARALINDPKILIADEPTGNLDDATAKQIIKLLKNLHKTHKTTMVIATHDQSIAKVADKVIKL